MIISYKRKKLNMHLQYTDKQLTRFPTLRVETWTWLVGTPTRLSSMGLLEAGLVFFDYGSSRNLILFGPFSHSNDYYAADPHF